MANILLIEPDRVLAAIYYEALTNAGHQVMVALGAQTAIMSADKQLLDLIILELQLVEHSGIEFMYELRSYTEWQNIPLVVQTIIPPAEFNESTGIMGEELGVIQYLYKPSTSLKKLIETVSAQLAVLA